MAGKVETDMLLVVRLLEAAEAVSAARAETAARKAAVVAAVSSETDKVAYMRMILTSPVAVVACSPMAIRVSAAAEARVETLARELGMGILTPDLAA